MDISAYIDRAKDVFLYSEGNPLLFNSGLFLFLFAGFLIVYKALSAHPLWRKLFVIAFSLYFYYKSSAGCCFILLGVCLSDYLLGNLLGWLKSDFWRRCVVAVNVIVNVGMLVYFKYFNLMIDIVSNFTVKEFDALDVILPAGISFFTFRSISYIVDIYRGEIKPARNLIDYTFFLTFFPPLLAGPVVRAKDLLPQIKESPEATHEMASEGLFLIMAGLIKKVLIADYISGNFVDRIFDNPTLYSGFENLMGITGFTIQLYCDFSGYSDMAIGIALMLGYRFKENFAAPFKAQNPSEFWRRWHISLSTWLRDYIYIPLGGNRKGTRRTYINNFATMLIGGLWHGAAWKFVFWGAMHGAGLAVHKASKPWLDRLGSSWPVKALSWFVTMTVVALLWVFFRADSWTDSWLIIKNAFTDFSLDYALPFASARMLWLIMMLVIIVAHALPANFWGKAAAAFVKSPWIIKLLIFIVVVQLVIELRGEDVAPFIYFQF